MSASAIAGEMPPPQMNYHFPWNRRRKCLSRGFLQLPELRAAANARWAELAKTVCGVRQRRFAD
jgi:hypothetical protein